MDFEFLSGMFLPQNILMEAVFFKKGPRTCKVTKSEDPMDFLDFQTLLVLGPLEKLLLLFIIYCFFFQNTAILNATKFSGIFQLMSA